MKRDTQLVRDIVVFIRCYVVLPREQLIVTALWIIHTHTIEHIEQTPYLSVTSPEKRCGKSRLLEVIGMLSARPWFAITPSEPVVYRQVDKVTPTLLLDEVDTIFNARSTDKYEGLRAILNGGNRRGVTVPRCFGPKSEIREYKVYCAKVLAGIGTLPDTVADRSIPIRLERKTKDDRAREFRRRDVQPEADELRERVETWAEDHGVEVGAARPRMPDALDDRAKDGCEVLVSIADLLGCGTAARKALLTLYGTERMDDIELTRVRLLRDVRTVFGKKRRSMPTEALLSALVDIDESGWAHYYGHIIEARDLSALLGRYGVKPKNIRIKQTVVKGYKRVDLYKVWERYL